MSRFSGKCDLYDWLAIGASHEKVETLYDFFVKRRVRLFDNCRNPITISKPSDLVPYYPRIVIIGISNKKDGDRITLSNRSYVEVMRDMGCHVAFYENELAEELERVKREEDIKHGADLQE